MAKKKISKQDLKSDELRDVFDNSWIWVRDWIQRRPDIAMVVGFIILAVAVGTPFYMMFRNRQEARASDILSRSKVQIQRATQATDLATRDGLLQEAINSCGDVIENYGHTSSYREALKTQARANEEMGQFQSSIDAYDRLLTEAPDHPDVDQLLFAKAAILQEINRFAEAAAVYEQLLQRDSAQYLQSQVVFQLASVYDLGLHDKGKAIHYYQQVPKPAPGETELWYLETRHRLTALGVAVPEDDDDVPVS